MTSYRYIFRWKLQCVATDFGNLINGREMKLVDYRGWNTFMMKEAIRRAYLTTVLVTICYLPALASRFPVFKKVDVLKLTCSYLIEVLK